MERTFPDMMARTLMTVCLLLAPVSAWGQQAVAYDPAEQVHWAAAAFFGTGWYQVEDNRKAFIFRIPPRQVLREPGWHGDGSRAIGVEIHYPLTLGLHQIDDIPDFIEFDNYGTISFTPGVHIEIPVSERWHLRPNAHLGFGYERTSGEWAGVWYGGINSRYLLDESETFTWSLLNAVSYAGYKPEYRKRGRYGSAMAGLEFNQRIPGREHKDDPVYVNWHITYTYLFDQLNFHVTEDEVVSVRDEWELGLALGQGRKPVKIWFLSFEQVGLAFKFSSNGEYRAITFNLRSPFTL